MEWLILHVGLAEGKLHMKEMDTGIVLIATNLFMRAMMMTRMRLFHIARYVNIVMNIQVVKANVPMVTKLKATDFRWLYSLYIILQSYAPKNAS